LHAGKDTPGLTDGGRLPHYDEGRRNATDAVCNRTLHSWEGMDDRRRCINIAALEQSNGFTLLGDVPPDERSLGRGGHVRDKDGTFAAVLMAELAQYAKERGTNLLDLLDEKIYLDPDIGLYVTYYEPDPLDGEYEGLAGYTKKRAILEKAEDLFRACSASGPRGATGGLSASAIVLGGVPVVGATVYPTGKYDAINWPGFPDEGYRFYFDAERRSHLTIRPSGTSNALRFHVQLFGGHPTREALIREKAELRATAARVVGDVRRRIGART
jgi:phosphomannomutase